MYPIEAAHEGTFVGWKTKVDETVLVGQVIGTCSARNRLAHGLAGGGDTSAISKPSKMARSASDLPVQLPPSPPPEQAAIAKRVGSSASSRSTSSARLPGAVPREPVLAPAISQRLALVVPATIELAIDWSAIRAARQIAQAARSGGGSVALVDGRLGGHAGDGDQPRSAGSC